MTKDIKLPDSARIFQTIHPKKALAAIMGLSLMALLFLVWLIYIKPPAEFVYPWVKHLGALNAAFNGLSTVFLAMGFIEIKKRRFNRHMKFMISAFVSSAFFLISYVIYHHFVGDSKFLGEGLIRYFYFFILISHIVLSAFIVPLVLTTFYYAFSANFEKHRKIARWTLPIWLYVSVTGVLVFLMLKIFG